MYPWLDNSAIGAAKGWKSNFPLSLLEAPSYAALDKTYSPQATRGGADIPLLNEYLVPRKHWGNLL